MLQNPGPRLRVTLSLLIPFVAAACGHDEDHTPAAEAITPELVAEGQAVYAAAGTCSACHGADAQGAPLGPDLTDGSWTWVDPASPQLLNDVMEVIRTGVPEPQDHMMPMLPMGGASLSEPQLRAVAAYLISLN